jgi:hypothetical protein
MGVNRPFIEITHIEDLTVTNLQILSDGNYSIYSKLIYFNLELLFL